MLNCQNIRAFPRDEEIHFIVDHHLGCHEMSESILKKVLMTLTNASIFRKSDDIKMDITLFGSVACK